MLPNFSHSLSFFVFFASLRCRKLNMKNKVDENMQFVAAQKTFTETNDRITSCSDEKERKVAAPNRTHVTLKTSAKSRPNRSSMLGI